MVVNVYLPVPPVGPLSIQCSFAVHWEEFDQFQVGSGAGPLFGPAERDRVAGRLVRLRRALYRPLRRLPNSPSAFRHVSRGTSVFSILLITPVLLWRLEAAVRRRDSCENEIAGQGR